MDEVLITATKLAVRLAGKVFGADIVQVRCLKGRVRRLMPCSRAHEGNFQSLYYWNGELACRNCLGLRYRSNLAASATARARLARHKFLDGLGGIAGGAIPVRKPYRWRKRHARLAARWASLTLMDYAGIRGWLTKQAS